MLSSLRLAMRLAVSVVAMLVVWTTSGVARADAPQCDRRGAITFAEAPTLQFRDVSVDVGTGSGCGDDDEAPSFCEREAPQAPTAPAAMQASDLLPTSLATVPVAHAVLWTWPVAPSFSLPSGTRLLLERPPRL